jgi:LmbE family N-acetylglucosaminyl deacetylase
MADVLIEVPAVALAIYAHPDDPDVACGGTLARWAEGGGEVHVCICARGDKGSSDPDCDTDKLALRRRQEAADAAGILGVDRYHWLDYPDGELDDRCLRERLVALIRELRPTAVVAPDPTAVFFGQHYVNHRDHRATGWAALDAVAPAAANPHYFPGPVPAHRVATMLLSGTLETDCWVDIEATLARKAAAVACHTSQVGEGGDWLNEVVRQRAADAGDPAGLRYAEGFRRLTLP